MAVNKTRQREPLHDGVPYTLVFEASDLEEVKAIALAEGVPASQIVRRAVVAYLAQKS